MPTVLNYHVVRGLPWERQISVKSRQTRWKMAVSEPNAFIQVSETHKKQIDASLMGNNNILLCLDADDTLDLPEGDFAYDVWATVNSVYQPVAHGKLTVETYAAVTPLEDDDAMELRYMQRTDFRRVFTWRDEDGDILVVQNGYMQAKNSAGTTVMDLRWYSTVPSEGTITALPAARRGYIAPASGATLELHISNTHTIAPGSYNYDLFVQDSVGDWDQLVKGTLVVEEAISSEPT